MGLCCESSIEDDQSLSDINKISDKPENLSSSTRMNTHALQFELAVPNFSTRHYLDYSWQNVTNQVLDKSVELSLTIPTCCISSLEGGEEINGCIIESSNISYLNLWWHVICIISTKYHKEGNKQIL